MEKNVSGTWTLIDVIGTIGTDPGTGWAVAGTANATVDRRLTRKSTICSPNTSWTSSAGTNTTNSEWIVSGTSYTTGAAISGHIETCTPTCTDPGLAFGVTSVSKIDTDANFTEAATSSSSGAITYSSSNTSAATVNSTTGEVDVVGTGTTTITATQVANGTFCVDTATYSLTVTTTTPFISTSGTLAALSTIYGTASTNTTFTVSAGNLTNNLIITAPTGFEVSLSAGSGFASSLDLGTTNRTNTIIYVRLAATTDFGTYSGNVVASSTGVTSVNVATASSNVTKKPLTITGLSGVNKVYNGTTTASLTGTATLNGVILSDDVTLSGTPTSNFADKNVGTGKAITITGYTLSGTKAANYSVTQPTGLTANITAKPLSITSPTIASKVYNASAVSGAVTVGTLSGFVGSETVATTATGLYADANAAIGKTATISYVLSNGTNGGLATNYSLTNGTGTGDITQANPVFTTSSINLNVAGTYNLPGTNITSTSPGVLTYSISSGGFATLTGSTINGVSSGIETLTVNQAASTNYLAGSTTVLLNVTSCSPPILVENFDYGGCDMVDISDNSEYMSNWAFQSDGVDPLKYNTNGLSYSGYASSGIGGSAQYQGGADDDFRRQISGTTGISSGNLYTSFMLNMTGAGTLDYFISFMDNNSTPAFYGRVYMRSSGSGYQLGITKSAATVVWNTPVLSFSNTYLIIIKNEFVAGTVNDVIKMWIIPSGVPTSEALAGTPTLTATTSDTDPATSIRYIAIRETGKEVGFVDGIRVATTWESLFCSTTPTATTYTWTGVSSSSWSNAANWSPSGVPSSIDNIVISSIGTNMLNITDCRTVKDFTLSGTGNFTASATGVFTINENISCSSSAAITLNCASQVFIKSTASQPIPPLTYGNLDVLGGPRVFSPIGIIKVCGGFNVSPPPYSGYTVTGSTVEYTSPASGWIMTPFTYNNLTFSGGGDFSFGYSSPAVNKTINVLGDFVQTAGIVYLGETSSATATLNVDGNASISGGTFNMNVTSGGTGIFNLKGDLTVTSAGSLFANSATNNSFNFIGTGGDGTNALTQIIDVANTITAQRINFNVNSGSYTKLINQDLALGTNSVFTVKTGATFDFGFNGSTSLNLVRVTSQTQQSFAAQTGSTLKITSPLGITSFGDYTGNVQVGATVVTNRLFDVGATYHYIGKENQVSGNALPSGITGKVIVELDTDALLFNASGNKTIATAGTLEIKKGIVEDTSSNSFGDLALNTGNLTMSGGRYRIFKAGTQPDLSGTYNLSAGIVELAGTLSKTIRSPKSYQNIEVTGNDVGNSSGNITLNNNGTFTVKNNGVAATPPVGIFTINANAIVGPTGTQTLTVEGGAIFKTGDMFGFSGGTNTSVKNDIETITLQDDSTVEYSKATGIGDQTITLFSPSYRNLTISGIGIKTLQNDTATRVEEDLNVVSAKLLLDVNQIITVKQGVIIAATVAELEISNNAQLIQIDEVDTNSGTNFKLKRLAFVHAQDYVYWSSPVADFNVGLIPTQQRYFWNTTYPNFNGTVGNWNSATGANATMIKGKGFIVNSGSGFPIRPLPSGSLETNFTGKPNNGTFTTEIQRGTNVASIDDNWNLVGNPYPSAIFAEEFLDANVAKINGSVWVWTHGQAPDNATDPYYDNFAFNYYATDYLKYNKLGASDTTFNGIIASGQGFMVNMLNTTPAVTDAVTFTNAMRTDATATPYNNSGFYRTANNNLTVAVPEEKHRIWLNIINTTIGQKDAALLGYSTNATLAVDHFYDCIFVPKTEVGIYTLVNDGEYVIQGRSLPFIPSDIVPVGVKIVNAGNHKIAIKKVDGLFEADQDIYLEDTVLNIIHDLKVAPYSFTSEVGVFNSRFKIRYTNAALSNDDFNTADNSVFVAANDHQISIKSEVGTIASVVVYDILGREIANKNNVNESEVVLSNIAARNQALIVKITLDNGQVITRKVIL